MNQIRFRPSNSNLVSEVIDGEAIIVNLEKGLYYSLAKVGGEIWDAIQGGATEQEIADALVGRYAAEPSEVQGAVAALIHQLKQEEIIVEDTGTDGNGYVFPSRSQDADRPAFEPPVLQKYTDMEEILMLDPIHEVDETGWPSAKRSN